MLANLTAHHVAAVPVLYRLTCPPSRRRCTPVDHMLRDHVGLSA
jgi:hypothetical protein